LAHSDSARLGEQCGTEPVGEKYRSAERRRSAGRWKDGRNDHWRIEPELGRVAHGIPDRVDRLKGLGNAVVPQIVEWIARRIIDNFSIASNWGVRCDNSQRASVTEDSGQLRQYPFKDKRSGSILS